MSHSGAPTVVNAMQAQPMKKPAPVDGEVREFIGGDGNVAFMLKFKGGTITIVKAPDAVPDINRTIVPKYGNVRLIEGQMHQVADLALEYLFKIKEGV